MQDDEVVRDCMDAQIPHLDEGDAYFFTCRLLIDLCQTIQESGYCLSEHEFISTLCDLMDVIIEKCDHVISFVITTHAYT